MKEVMITSVRIGDPGGDDEQLFAFRAPKDAHGGGITIIDATAADTAATNSGTTFTLGLLKYSNAGTPAVNGTIAAAIGGTAAPWAEDVPKAFSITDTFVDAGEWVVIDYQEIGSGNPTNCFVNIHYVMGQT